MADPLTTLQDDLNTLATADTGNPENGSATTNAPLSAAQLVLSLLADQGLVGSSIGTAVGGVYSAIANVITEDVVGALTAIAGELVSLGSSLDIADASSALSALQNALQTAQSLVPGASSATASAFAATAQFASLFGSLLQDANTAGGGATAAANTLYEIAQQLTAIATAFSNAALGSP